MPVAVAVTTLRDGVSDNKRFVDVSLTLTGTYDAGQSISGFLIPMDKLPFDEVTDVMALSYLPAESGCGVQLAGTKGAPRLRLRNFNVTNGAIVNPTDTNAAPAWALRVRLIGA